ncbi:ABC transporter substrate-binding protein [Microbacterium sp.]|jgi:peptide/nickel transport system substrate-binding protein|uniref:ABC transporter substrate-binding protein n=1 Tax=Microbacterium sp. TaxID=51671 RepID=UPI0037CAD22E
MHALPRPLKIAVPMTALALTLAGCSGGAAPTSTDGTDAASEPVVGGTITVTLPSDPGTLDSAVSTLQVTQYMNSHVLEGLLALDSSYSPKPMLADTYEVSADGLRYTFDLRDGVLFHDGSALDAEDVVASLTRFFDVSSVGKQAKPSISTIEATDDDTVLLTLSSPRYPLLSELASPGAAILPAEIASAAGAVALSAEQAIGTGPYQLDAYDTGVGVDLIRFDDYASRSEEDWGGYAGAKHAYLDEIDFKFVAEDATVVNGLTAGQWQVSTPGNDQYDVLKANPNLVVEPSAGGVVNTIVLNHNEASVFSDPKAREALNLLLDKTALAAASGTSGDLLVPTGAFASPENEPMYSEEGEDVYSDHDPERAAELFAEAGVTRVRMLVPTTYPQMVAWGTVVQNALSEIGIDAAIESYDNTTVRAVATDEPESWDLTFTFINGVLTSPSQVNWLQPTYISSYMNADLDSLLADYSDAADADAAKAVVDDIQALVWDDIPSVVIYGSKQYAAWTSDLQGFDNFALILYNSWLAE